MVNSAFGVAMTIILVIYGIYYAVNFLKDIFFDKSGEVVQEAAVQEQEVDIDDELKDFTKFNANENDAEARARKEAEKAARRREEDGVEYGDPGHDAEPSESKATDQTPPDEDSRRPEVIDDFEEKFKFNGVETALSNFNKERLPEQPSMTGGLEVDDFDKKFDFSGVTYAVKKVKAAA